MWCGLLGGMGETLRGRSRYRREDSDAGWSAFDNSRGASQGIPVWPSKLCRFLAIAPGFRLEAAKKCALAVSHWPATVWSFTAAGAIGIVERDPPVGESIP